MTLSPFAMLRRRIRHDERGFSLLEMVVAMGVIFISMTVLAATALVGFHGSQTARQREVATALGDKLVEQVRALPFAAVKEGLKDSDLSGDSSIVSCSGTYKYQSCSGETVVHQAALTYTSTPLYPHRVTLGSSDGFSQGGTRSVYVTSVTGSTNVYRLTIVISWTFGGSTSSIQTQTQLSNPTGSGGSSSTTGTSTAFFFGSGSVSPGSVVVKPNGSVYNGVGVTGLTTSVWNTTDSMTQRLYAMDAELTQGQLTAVGGQTTTTSVEKSISGVVTSAGGTSTYSSADDDLTTSSIGTSSSPTAISQPGTGVSMSLTGSGNSLGLNQYTVAPPSITLRGSTSNVANNASSLTLSAPSGTASGDLLVAQVGIDGNGTITAPSGWTLIRSDTNGTQVKSSAYYKVAGSSESTYAFTVPGGSYSVGGVLGYTGVDTAAPVNVSGGSTGNSATATAPSVTTTTASTRYIGFFVAYRQSVVAGSPLASHWGGSTFYAGTGSGGGSNIKTGGAAGDMTLASAGASSTTTGAMDGSNKWVAQSIVLKPSINILAPGTETGATVSTTAAAVSPSCGSPAQTDGKACAYATLSYSSGNQAFLDTTADLTGYGIGKCVLYSFNPPSSNPTSYAYGRRQATSSDGKVREDVKRYYGTHTFGQFCSGSSATPAGWPGYFVKYDAGTSACEAIAEAGVSASAPSTTTCGTIYVWNGSGTTSFSPPSSGTWSTNPTTVSYTSGSYKYDMTATLGSGQTSTTSTGSSPITVGKAVVGSPVVGTITYKLTDVTNSRILIDVTLTIDLGTLTSNSTYTAAA